MTIRLRGEFVLSAALAGLVLAGACSSPSAPPKPKPSPSATDSFTAELQREEQIRPVFAQCLAQHNIPIWDTASGRMNVARQGTQQGWYRDGHVITGDAFRRWWSDHDGTYAISSALGKPSKKLDEWVTEAATNGTWPTKACGPMPAISGHGS